MKKSILRAIKSVKENMAANEVKKVEIEKKMAIAIKDGDDMYVEYANRWLNKTYPALKRMDLEGLKRLEAQL
jgi:hypothetical protein